MAELGDFLIGGSDAEVSKIDVRIEHLDYDHVAKCNELPELKAILNVLKVRASHNPTETRKTSKC